MGLYELQWAAFLTTDSKAYTETSVLSVTSVRVVPCTAPSSLIDHVGEPPYLNLNLEKIASAVLVPNGDGSSKMCLKIKVMLKYIYIIV